LPPSQPAAGQVAAETVEQVVRGQLSKALGGRRGIVEAAVPTIVFTVTFLTTRDLRLAVGVSVATALVLLVLRVLHRSSVQFVLNSLVGIGIGALFAWRSAQSGGSADDQALAYFLPGLLYNGGYAVLMVASNVVSWPLVGFMVGSVAGDPTEWHRDPQVVRLCRNLTWMLAAPCVIRLVVQLPIWLAGQGADDPSPMIAALGVSKIVMGWPLQVLALAGMAWLLARNATPVSAADDAD
jgi:uncharacterized protein DUF3159